MGRKPRTIKFRRKREGKTDYKKRLKLLLSEKPRFVVRPSLKGMTAQIIETEKKEDRILAASSSNELKKLGWNFNKGNIPAAYLTGLIAAKKSLKNGVKKAILDIGLKRPVKGSRIFACLKGAVDGGLNIPFSDTILPSEERIKGEHIIKYGEIKNKDMKEMSKIFEDIKNKILKSD